MAEDKVLTAQEVADLLKISKNTVYELIKRGELGAYKIGNKMRVEMSQVDAYKNKTKKRPTSESLIKEA
ncbi:MAG: DNA-binding protein excisionase family, partial [Clostridia bacterium]|nr:DNA-binding protein excisionase family [Clostridia bacterium]